MQESYKSIGIRPWSIKGLKYQEKSGEIIEFEATGTYWCDYDTSKYNPISNYILQIDNSFTSVIKNIINEKLVEYQNSSRSFNDFAEYLKSSKMNFEFYTKLDDIVEPKGFKTPTAKCLEVKTNIQNEPVLEKETKEEPIIINTNSDKKDGQNKCPKCGATDISINISNGNLRCNFCRFEFKAEKIESLETDISTLKGQVMTTGAQDVVADSNDIMTFKCSSCGAEVVIDTSEALQARCHWCRNTLSVNQQIPNGAVPDVVLPFNMTKDVARAEIEKFVKKRSFFAHPTFKKEFTTENIMGVYLPYMIVDINAHCNMSGQGEILIRKYTVGSGDNRKTRYDADLYNIEREFDIQIDGLTVESNKEKLKISSSKTNNVINAIMPFDLENCVKWNTNYLKGYTSEKRDTNIEELKDYVSVQAKDVVRHKANETLLSYDRGVRWDREDLSIIGQRWKTAYLPVWLYSYQQKSNNQLHYVAVNARTKETMGSVPIHMPKLLLFSVLVEFLAFIAMINVDFDYSFLFLLAGFIFFFVFYSKYRNQKARHNHEKDTKSQMINIRKHDQLVKNQKGLSNSCMSGANNDSVNGIGFQKNKLLKK